MRDAEGCVRIDVDGRTYAAAYTLLNDVVTVKSAFGQKSAPLGENAAEEVAKAILRELIALETKQLD
jgi:hypothetical protein